MDPKSAEDGGRHMGLAYLSALIGCLMFALILQRQHHIFSAMSQESRCFDIRSQDGND